ncbi:hypothetical protein SAMN02746068_00499 [Lactococcus chungangensis CAU 28 = DSM 22330]|uniref:Uncharacterized protein n=1 Tax=Pseudolactococcus chungangensis CAU 28 = DSM 22330 TaxID=1122154 RepID=A0A1K2H661_9LACT|nr:hypothetical protein [Lactococcus chungangensis]SFZ71828.1 hypothetical protein SAMN02746068_00499 [Lactococcus chungangensis CAU 28 = DSM 22330]
MTIVASNNITVSNVNDGTITHYAYAYSADGTDRFTTVYPNLNLLKGTKTSKSITGNNAVNQGGLLYSFDNNNTLVNQGFSVNDTIILEFDWSATNPASGNFVLQWQGAPWGFNVPTINLSSTNGSGHVIHTYNIRAADVASTAVATGVGYRLDNIPTNTVITFSNVTIRKAKSSQPWMPSSSEVTTADWPSYIGQYSDFSSTASTDPAKYTPWTIFKGNDGVGVSSTVITYAISTSGTTAPSTGWTSSVPSIVKGQYLWTKTVWTYTDNSSKTWYSVTYNSKDGTNGTNGTSGIIVSSVAPDSPQTGQLWQDTSTTPQLVKKWTGNEWVIWELYAQNLKADSLEALSAKIGKISNTFDNSSGGIDNKGEIAIEDSVKVVYYNANTRTTIDLVTSTSGQGLFAQYLPDKNDTTKFQQAWYTPSYLYFSDSINNWTGQITAENVTLAPWTNLTYLSGYTTAENNPCQYRKIKNLDGSYTVQFRGQVKPVSGSFPGTNSESNFQIIANLPVDIRPIRHTFLSAVGDMMGTQTIRIGALSDGRIQVGVRGTASSYIGINSLIYTI